MRRGLIVLLAMLSAGCATATRWVLTKPDTTQDEQAVDLEACGLSRTTLGVEVPRGLKQTARGYLDATVAIPDPLPPLGLAFVAIDLMPDRDYSCLVERGWIYLPRAESVSLSREESPSTPAPAEPPAVSPVKVMPKRHP